MAKKSNEEQEMDAILRAQASNLAMWQKQAQAGSEMRKWVEEGHYDFLQKRILQPIELEWFKKVKTVKMGSRAIEQIARIQGAMDIFDVINARINNMISTGQDALDHMKDLENSTSFNGDEELPA